MQPDVLGETGLDSFDAWAATVDQTVAAVELAPDGGSYRVTSRLARYRNVPELIAQFRRTADVRVRMTSPHPARAQGRLPIGRGRTGQRRTGRQRRDPGCPRRGHPVPPGRTRRLGAPTGGQRPPRSSIRQICARSGLSPVAATTPKHHGSGKCMAPTDAVRPLGTFIEGTLLPGRRVAAEIGIAGSSTTRDVLGQDPVTTRSAVRHAWTGQNWGWGGSPV
jgi:hypothetical protein